MRTVRFIYNLLLYLSFPLLFPWFAYRRVVRGKPFPDVAARLGRKLPEPPPEGVESVWIHAVSVGEALVVGPLVARIEADRVPRVIYLSTTTATGREAARKAYGDRVRLLACPFDLPGAVRRVLDRLRPSRLVIAETELWPNLITLAARRGIPVSVVNGRISDRAFPRYRRVRAFMAPFLRQLDAILAQSPRDAERFVALGARPETVRSTGNLKFDALKAVLPDVALAARVRDAFGEPEPRVVLCGSTTEGEETLLLEPFRRLAADFPRLRWVVAPRHPERFEAVTRLFTDAGFPTVRRSRLPDASVPAARVVVLDTIGELSRLYFTADLVFVGGSLAPRGGHNILEPAAAGKPVLVGPSMENFREILEAFREEDAVVVVPDAQALEDALRRLLADPAACAALGRRAENVTRSRQGAAERCHAALFGSSDRG